VLAPDTDPESFAAQYPGVTVSGYYSGGLNNNGERIALNDRNGNIITSVDYSDRGGWPRRRTARVRPWKSSTPTATPMTGQLAVQRGGRRLAGAANSPRPRRRCVSMKSWPKTAAW